MRWPARWVAKEKGVARRTGALCVMASLRGFWDSAVGEDLFDVRHRVRHSLLGARLQVVGMDFDAGGPREPFALEIAGDRVKDKYLGSAGVCGSLFDTLCRRPDRGS